MTRTQMGLYYGGTVAKEYLTKDISVTFVK